MTESELCGSSFDWEGGSPSVFFRPMNPALSAQHYFPEDSPVLLEHKDSSKRGGLFLTPASPLFGSLSYMSQESSCCSALNNAVILEDDDNETIPTDERPNLVPLAPEDVSPIVDKSFNVSDVPAGNSFPPAAVSEDRSNSSLQDLLFNQPVAPVDTAFIGNSPGPQWSPGIRGSLKSPTVIRIESTLNYFDGIASASPKKAESSMSLSAIFPSTQPTALSSILETPAKPDFNFSDDATAGSLPNDDRLPIAPPVVKLVSTMPQQVVPGEPSPVRKLTHHRSVAGPRVSLPSLRLPTGREENSFLHDVTRSFNLSSHRRKIVLSSEEREIMEAEEGRRRLLAQIRSNRSHIEHSSVNAGSASARLSARLAESRARVPRIDITNSTYIPFSSTPSRPTNVSGLLSRPTVSSSRFYGGTPSGLRSGERSVLGSFLAASRVRSATPDRVKTTYATKPVERSTLFASRMRSASPAMPSIYTSHRRPTATAVRPAWR